MPRRKRSSETLAKPLDRDTFFHFVGHVNAAKQKLDDAAMAHAGEWKKADPYGIHAQAAKLFCRLDKMEELKRGDFLRAFDKYRDWSDWDAQADLVDAVEEDIEAQERAEREGDDENDESGEPSREPATIAADKESPVPEVEADEGVDSAAEVTEELARAGFLFADGKSAALNGEALETNPHPQDGTAHGIWSRGHAQGLREIAEREAATEAAEAAPVNGRRGRARTAEHEAPALVH